MYILASFHYCPYLLIKLMSISFVLVSESEVQNMVNVYKKLAALSPRDTFIDRKTL